MQTVENQTADGITVAMDGKFFLNCHFTRCLLFFAGGDCEWRDTYFTNCRIELIGPAARAVSVLHSFGFAKDFGGGEPSAPVSSKPSIN